MDTGIKNLKYLRSALQYIVYSTKVDFLVCMYFVTVLCCGCCTPSWGWWWERSLWRTETRHAASSPPITSPLLTTWLSPSSCLVSRWGIDLRIVSALPARRKQCSCCKNRMINFSQNLHLDVWHNRQRCGKLLETPCNIMCISMSVKPLLESTFFLRGSTCLDQWLVCSPWQPSLYDLPGALSSLLCYRDLGVTRGREVLRANARAYLSNADCPPLLLHPEGATTSGNLALMKWVTLQYVSVMVFIVHFVR